MTSESDKAIDALERVVAVCVTLADLVPDDVEVFVADTALQWAAEMGLIRIGEGINRVPAEILARFPGPALAADDRDAEFRCAPVRRP